MSGRFSSFWTSARLPIFPQADLVKARSLAGLAARIYPEPTKFADNWRLEHRVKPATSKVTASGSSRAERTR
jgi:hypothetical protein